MDNILSELSYLFRKKAVWLGKNSPIKAEALSLEGCTNFRTLPEKHGTFEVVWIYEYNLFSFTSWPLLFDEAIRLLGEHGTLVVHTEDTSEGTIVELKSYLFRRYDIDVQLSKQFKIHDRNAVSVFKVHRTHYQKTKNRNWTIGVLTNGVKNDNVTNLINKATTLAEGLKIEFIVAGPFNAKDTQCPDAVKVLECDHDALPRISEKKNLIAQHAAHENIAIFHDRYQINDDFFSGFEKFGYDFDFLAIQLNYEDGSLYPAYAGFNKPTLRWVPPLFDRFPGTLYDGHFVNGSLMFFKRSTLKAINFNPLLLHEEGEDLEISFLLRQFGVIPRFNIYSSAVTIDTEKTHTAGFIDISDLVQKPRTGKYHLLKKIWTYCPEVIKKKLRHSSLHNLIQRNIQLEEMLNQRNIQLEGILIQRNIPGREIRKK